MRQYLPLLSFLLFPLLLTAQQQLSDRLIWQDAPEVVEWEGERAVLYAFAKGADAGAFLSSKTPSYIHTFAADRRGYRVEVTSVELEPFRPHPDFDLSQLPETFAFSVGVHRQPEGLLGKVSAPAIIRTPAGASRLKSFSINLLPAAAPATGRSEWSTTSVLSSGTFYKMAVTGTGVHKIDRAFLADQLQVAGLDGLDPRNFKIFTLPGGMLPETTNDFPEDDLNEMPITVEGEGDGSFDGGDYILFYAEGADGQRYDEATDRFVYQKNIYTDRNYVFLQVDGGRGRRVGGLSGAGNGPVFDAYDAFYHFEEDKFNVLHEIGGNAHGSGQEWFGDLFRVSREKDYGALFRVPDLVPEERVELFARMGLRSDQSSRFFVEANGEVAQSGTASRVSGSSEQSPAVYPVTLVSRFNTTGPDIRVKVSYPTPPGSDESQGWLDYIELRARRRLSFADRQQFSFRVPESRNANAATYRLADAGNDGRVWRVDGADIRRAELSNGSFSAATDDRVHEFVAFRPGAELLRPEPAGRVENQNLHAISDADMLIITHANFLTQAEELAEHRRSHNGLTTYVVTVRQIYNEFSSGRDDAAALRNFARMVYERADNLRHLLLFGDGSFDHRNLYGFGTNFLPVYEHTGRITQVSSFPADDFFGIFEPAFRGQPLAPTLAINVGRLPVKSADEANGTVRKLIRYDTNPEVLGDWRTRMVFVGDDEDGGIHTRDVNGVANAVAARKPDLNFDKLYFDLFPQQSLSAGERYPDVTAGLDRAVFRGALAITYLGHGGPRGWAQERVLTIPQVRNWRRPPGAIDPIQPPVFVTATCTFSNYDDASFVSAGEESILTQNGGAIALLTTTRPVFATKNFELTTNTVNTMLERPDGNWRSLGDVIRIAKNMTTDEDDSDNLDSDTQNARKFTLIGDPATTVAFPEHGIRTTMIDSLPLDEERIDTVRALQQMRISGEVVDVNGNLLSNFNGDVFPTIYDKPQTVSTLGQDNGSPIQNFQVQRSIIFRGRATVTNGKFSFEFIVPNDINYEFGAGKVSYYARDPAQFTDASGFYDKLIIGGTSSDNQDDDEGPLVEVFMDDENFVAGSEVDEDPILLINLTDDLGINVTGNSIGHDLEAVLDEDSRNPIVLNDYYEADTDNFRSGKVRYPLFDLEPGKHTVTVRAWDVANNSATGQTEFIVAANGRDALSHVLNYPNPFTDRTCFQFDHTLVGQNVEAIVQVYTISGRLVKTLTRNYDFSDGSIRQDDCLEWDGLDDYGDQLARGVYLYQIRLRGDETTMVDGELEKLVILK